MRVLFFFMALMATLYSHIRRYLRITLAVSSAISGLIFLSQSSFFKLQFDDTPTSEILFFGLLSAFLVFLVFAAPNWGESLRKVWALNFSATLAVDCVFMAIVWSLVFLIKYPRFDVNSKYRDSCVLEEAGNKTRPHASPYGLLSLGAFALLALLLSSERQTTTELGFFGVLIGLIMDTSLETTATGKGPIVWYVLGSVVYCVGLIFLKHYIKSSMRNGDDYLVLPESERPKQCKRNSSREVYRNSLVFVSALVGTVCLFLSPFSEQQFEDSTNLKAVCFITFSFFMGISLLKAREVIDVLVTTCRSRYLVKAAVKISLLLIVSLAIFVTKYPRFVVHSKYIRSCKEQYGKRVVITKNQFDVYSTGSFSLFALTLSSRKEQAVKLGLFTFLLELTMDASIKILGNDEPGFLIAFFAALYCALLILVKCYLDSLIEKRDDLVWQQRGCQDQQDASMALNARDQSAPDEQPLIEGNSGEEMDHQGIGEINGLDSVARESECVGGKEDTESSYEPSTSIFDAAPSHRGDGAQLLNRRERHRVRRREKAKREKERMKEKRNQKEDLWISVV